MSWLNTGLAASLTFATHAQGCAHVGVADRQGSQSARHRLERSLFYRIAEQYQPAFVSPVAAQGAALPR